MKVRILLFQDLMLTNWSEYSFQGFGIRCRPVWKAVQFTCTTHINHRPFAPTMQHSSNSYSICSSSWNDYYYLKAPPLEFGRFFSAGVYNQVLRCQGPCAFRLCNQMIRSLPSHDWFWERFVSIYRQDPLSCACALMVIANNSNTLLLWMVFSKL